MVINREAKLIRRPEKGTLIRRRENETLIRQLPIGNKKVLNRENKSALSGQLQDPIAAGLAQARKAWKEYRANAKYDRNAVYVYLQAVFDVVQQWKLGGRADEYSLKALKRQKFSIRMNADAYARMIYCTSEEDDPKQRSKWAIIMAWVATHNKRRRSFTEFVKKNGGLNKCAEAAACRFEPDWT